MDRDSQRLKGHLSTDAVSESLTFRNAVILLKSLVEKGTFNTETILRIFQQYNKKIDGLTLDNILVKRQLEQYQSRDNASIDGWIKAEKSTNIEYLQGQMKELLKELFHYRQLDDDRMKMKTQIDKLTLFIKQMACNEESFNNSSPMQRLTAGDTTTARIETDYERLENLLNRMLGMEGKIVEFKRQAAHAKRLEAEVDRLHQELARQREHGRGHTEIMNERLKERAENAQLRMQTYKRERDMYANVTISLEEQVKELVAECDMYKKKAEHLESKVERLLLEMEKIKVKNAAILCKIPAKNNTVVKRMRNQLQDYKNEVESVQKLNEKYKDKLEKLTIKFKSLKTHYQRQKQEFRMRFTNYKRNTFKYQPIKNAVNEALKPLKRYNSRTISIISSKSTRSVASSFRTARNLQRLRYWRKVSKMFSIFLKIYPNISFPADNFPRKFIVKTNNDMIELQKQLAPDRIELTDIVRQKNEAELNLEESKNKARIMIGKIQNELANEKSHNW